MGEALQKQALTCHNTTVDMVLKSQDVNEYNQILDVKSTVKHEELVSSKFFLIQSTFLHKTAYFSTGADFTSSQSQPFSRANHDESFHQPFVPDFPVVCLPPHTNLELRIVREVERRLR